MANRYFQQFSGTPVHGVVSLYGTVTTSTSGAISSSSVTYGSIVKTATKTGRYTVTLADSYVGFLDANVIVESSSDAAYGTAKGVIPVLRNVAVTTSTGGTLNIQFIDKALADAELPDGAKFYFRIDLKNSSAQP